MIKTKKFIMRMEEDFHQTLKNIAKEERTSMANIIVNLLLKKYPKLKKEIK